MIKKTIFVFITHAALLGSSPEMLWALMKPHLREVQNPSILLSEKIPQVCKF